MLSGLSPDRRLVEFMELADHPFYVGTQAHPEFKSRPDRPHPLFRELVRRRSPRARAATPTSIPLRRRGRVRRHDRRPRRLPPPRRARRSTRGHIWRVVAAAFEAPDGERVRRDTSCARRAPSPSCPLLFDAEGHASVVLVRQYRPALDRDLVEIPAGMRDVDGEAPEQTAQRELAEEVGLAGGHASSSSPSSTRRPGMTDATIRLPRPRPAARRTARRTVPRRST